MIQRSKSKSGRLWNVLKWVIWNHQNNVDVKIISGTFKPMSKEKSKMSKYCTLHCLFCRLLILIVTLLILLFIFLILFCTILLFAFFTLLLHRSFCFHFALYTAHFAAASCSFYSLLAHFALYVAHLLVTLLFFC